MEKLQEIFLKLKNGEYDDFSKKISTKNGLIMSFYDEIGKEAIELLISEILEHIASPNVKLDNVDVAFLKGQIAFGESLLGWLEKNKQNKVEIEDIE